MYKVIYEPEAENDFIDIIAYYTEKEGFLLGETMLNRIEKHISLLKTMPYRATESQLIANTREFLIERLPYKAYIKIHEDIKTVFILNVIHTSRNFPN